MVRLRGCCSARLLSGHMGRGDAPTCSSAVHVPCGLHFSSHNRARFVFSVWTWLELATNHIYRGEARSLPTCSSGSSSRAARFARASGLASCMVQFGRALTSPRRPAAGYRPQWPRAMPRRRVMLQTLITLSMSFYTL